jgi:hypothetical protein
MRSADVAAHHATRGRRRLLALELLAQSRVEPAYFVVARREKNASAPSSSARRRAISRRSQLVLGLLLGRPSILRVEVR